MTKDQKGNLTLLLAVIFVCIVVALMITDNNAKHNNNVQITTQAKKDTVTTNERKGKYDKWGIPLELSDEEQENIDVITEAMKYMTGKYGLGAFIFKSYEKIDDKTEEFYTEDRQGDTYLVIRSFEDNEYIWSDNLMRGYSEN